jgi:hypothetical protein
MMWMVRVLYESTLAVVWYLKVLEVIVRGMLKDLCT